MNDQLQQVIRSYLDYYSRYNEAKERIAYLATALYLAGAFVLLTRADDLPPSRSVRCFLALGVVVAAAVVITFVCWQFNRRREGAVIFSRCVGVLDEMILRPAQANIQGSAATPLVRLLEALQEPERSEGRRLPTPLAASITSMVLLTVPLLVVLLLDPMAAQAVGGTPMITDWIIAGLTLIIAVFTFLVWRVYRRIAWLTGSMETHSDLMLRLQALKGGADGKPIELVWWDPTIEAAPGVREHGKPVDMKRIHIYLPLELRRNKPPLWKRLWMGQT